MAAECGTRAVAIVWEDLTPARILTAGAFRNALVAYMALGGSTNAAVHTIAIARRAGIALTLADLDAVAREIPVLADLFPSGKHLMEDFFFAGGLPALLERLRDRLSLDERTVNGRTLGENIAGAKVWNDEIIRPLDNPVTGDPATRGALAVLYGNLAPRGCVVKPSAASPDLMQHTGPALVFDDHTAALGRHRRSEGLRSRVTPCWSCAMQARWAHRGFPNGATSRSRKSCSRRACATWSASRTRA